MADNPQQWIQPSSFDVDPATAAVADSIATLFVESLRSCTTSDVILVDNSYKPPLNYAATGAGLLVTFDDRNVLMSVHGPWGTWVPFAVTVQNPDVAQPCLADFRRQLGLSESPVADRGGRQTFAVTSVQGRPVDAYQAAPAGTLTAAAPAQAQRGSVTPARTTAQNSTRAPKLA